MDDPQATGGAGPEDGAGAGGPEPPGGPPESAPAPRRRGPHPAWLVAMAGLVVVLIAAVFALPGDEDRPEGPFEDARPVVPEPLRDATVYAGLGTWVDIYDFVPELSGGQPSVTPADVGAMAAAGVQTLYLQGARAAGPLPVALVGPFLAEAHEHGMAVVAWYLPTKRDVAHDLATLGALRDLEWEGHRFDGIALNIEDVSTVGDVAERNRRTVDLVTAWREVVGDEAIAAVVLPPVLTEVVNTNFWPGFPWQALAPLVDVWMPMTYWTDRRADSGYRDGYRYTEESVRRLRSNVGDPTAAVHPIAGLAPAAASDDYRDFLRAVVDSGSVGASVYTWPGLSQGATSLLRDETPAALARAAQVRDAVAANTE